MDTHFSGRADGEMSGCLRFCVEVAARLVFFTLWTPDTALPNLVFEGLFMVHPPEVHIDQ
jgi:hypothetical protein